MWLDRIRLRDGMGFRITEDRIVGGESQPEYQVTQPFRQVLSTLPDDTVPQAMVMLGLLTEQLVPVDGDAERQRRIVADNLEETPRATVPEETVTGVYWLLDGLQEAVPDGRKQTIWTLVTTAGLLEPSPAGSSSRSNQSTDADDSSIPRRESLEESTGSDREVTDTVASSEPASAGTEQSGDTASDEESSTAAAEATRTSGVSDSPDPNPGDTDTTSTSPSSPSSSAAVDSGSATDTPADAFVCEYCAETFGSESALMSHSIRCTARPSDARFECEYCHNEYVSKHALSNHVDTCDARGIADDHECADCGAQFDSTHAWFEHKPCRSTSSSRSATPATSQDDVVKCGVSGTIDTYLADDGYGFVSTFDLEPEHSSQTNQSVDVFFHISNIPGADIEEGTRLKFDVHRTDDGLAAKNISRLRRRTPESRDDTFASTRSRWGKDS